MARPTVDIIIPFHGQYELTTRCLQGILSCTPNQPYNIILVDDCSPNKNYLEQVLRHGSKKIMGIRMPEHKGFVKALYEGYKLSKSPWIVFMHSDVEVKDIYWLINLQRTMEKMKKSGIKLVSSRTDNLGTGMPSDNLLNATEDKISETALPLICSLFHRELFLKIKGFLRPYSYAWFEDEELFWRMKRYRFSQAISHASFVHHEGGATINKLWTDQPKLKKIMEENYDLCVSDIKKSI